MKGSTTPSDYSTRAQLNAFKEKGVALITKYVGNPKNNFRHRCVVSSFLDLGVKVAKRKHLNGFKEIYGFETVYDNYGYFISVVICAKKEKIIGFDKIFKQVQEVYGDVLLPVYVLVANGVFGGWFALYFRKEKLTNNKK